MNTMINEAAGKMPQMMDSMSHMMSHPAAKGAAMAGAGYVARGIVTRSLFANPLLVLAVGVAGGVAAGYLLHQYRKEIVLAVSKAAGMSKDFALQQKENLADLMEEAKEQEAEAAQPATSVASPETPAATATPEAPAA
ncbi:hypothetical protein [Propionivibrio sp.]|uniref:hypothetical protein n=1 Tax=Propionivibrio sp. TaxID=2212460 RepID=UPI003BF1AF80